MAHFFYPFHFFKMIKKAGDRNECILIPEEKMNVFCLVGKIEELPSLKETVNGKCSFAVADGVPEALWDAMMRIKSNGKKSSEISFSTLNSNVSAGENVPSLNVKATFDASGNWTAVEI